MVNDTSMYCHNALQESNESLMTAKTTAEQTSAECRHLSVDCQQMRGQLREQQCRGQKLHDHMLRVSQKCKTDEQVSIEFYQLSSVNS